MNLRKLVDAMVNLGNRRPFWVVGCAVLLLVGAWAYASRLEVRDKDKIATFTGIAAYYADERIFMQSQLTRLPMLGQS